MTQPVGEARIDALVRHQLYIVPNLVLPDTPQQRKILISESDAGLSLTFHHVHPGGSDHEGQESLLVPAVILAVPFLGVKAERVIIAWRRLLRHLPA